MGGDLYFSSLVTKSLDPINSEERFFEGYLTVEVKDKQGEITIVDELYKVLPVWMDRGAPISDTHSNRIIGKGINFSRSTYKSGDEEIPAIKITGKIHKNYELDNEIWNKIKSGEYKGLSFGGATKSDRTPKVMKDGSVAYQLTDLEHYEVAVCKDPAVPLALITDFNPVAKAMADHTEDRDGKMVIKCSKFGCRVDKVDLSGIETFEGKVEALMDEGKSRESAEKIVGSFTKKNDYPYLHDGNDDTCAHCGGDLTCAHCGEYHGGGHHHEIPHTKEDMKDSMEMEVYENHPELEDEIIGDIKRRGGKPKPKKKDGDEEHWDNPHSDQNKLARIDPDAEDNVYPDEDDRSEFEREGDELAQEKDIPFNYGTPEPSKSKKKTGLTDKEQDLMEKIDDGKPHPFSVNDKTRYDKKGKVIKDAPTGHDPTQVAHSPDTPREMELEKGKDLSNTAGDTSSMYNQNGAEQRVNSKKAEPNVQQGIAGGEVPPNWQGSGSPYPEDRNKKVIKRRKLIKTESWYDLKDKAFELDMQWKVIDLVKDAMDGKERLTNARATPQEEDQTFGGQAKRAREFVHTDYHQNDKELEDQLKRESKLKPRASYEDSFDKLDSAQTSRLSEVTGKQTRTPPTGKAPKDLKRKALIGIAKKLKDESIQGRLLAGSDPEVSSHLKEHGKEIEEHHKPLKQRTRERHVQPSTGTPQAGLKQLKEQEERAVNDPEDDHWGAGIGKPSGREYESGYHSMGEQKPEDVNYTGSEVKFREDTASEPRHGIQQRAGESDRDYLARKRAYALEHTSAQNLPAKMKE